MSTNIKHNQGNDIIENELKFDSRNNLVNDTVEHPLPILTISLKGGRKSIKTLKSVLSRLGNRGANSRMISCKHIQPYKSKLRSNKVGYSMAAGPYIITHDLNVPFRMSYFSSSMIITHCLHVCNMRGDEENGCDMIIVQDLMVKSGLKDDFSRQVLEWDGTVLTMKEPGNFIVQLGLTKY